MSTDTTEQGLRSLAPLTPARVEVLLTRAGNEYGADHKDPNSEAGLSCSNVYRDDAGTVTGRCIAAQVLSYHGVSDHLLELHDGSVEEAVHALENLGLRVDRVALAMLAAAQGAQDLNAPWGTAVHVARRLYHVMANEA